MRQSPTQRKSRSAGFTLIELMVVAALIAILVVMSLPAIARFIRNYRIRGAMDQVTTEINQARLTAISKNANPGVAFVIADNNTYRWIWESTTPGAQVYGTLRDLPIGVQFVAGTDAGFRFSNLGQWCRPGTTAGQCAPGVPAVCRAGEAAQCSDAPGTYVTSSAAGSTVTVVEVNTGVTRAISIAPGGRVQTTRR